MTYLTGTGQVTHMVFASHFHQRDVSPLQRAVVKKESHSQAQVNSPTLLEQWHYSSVLTIFTLLQNLL